MFDLVPFRRKREDSALSMLKSFHDLFERPLLSALYGETHPFHTDIRETEEAYLIESEMPGFSKEDIEVDYSNGYLTIKASRREEEEQQDDRNRVIRKERYRGEFVRRFYVDSIDEEHIEARLKDGVLQLKVPKKEKNEPKRRIVIQ